jgi:hypothetical protein
MECGARHKYRVEVEDDQEIFGRHDISTEKIFDIKTAEKLLKNNG